MSRSLQVRTLLTKKPSSFWLCAGKRVLIFEIYVAVYVDFSTIARREPASSYVVETTFHISGPEFWQMTRFFPTIRS